MEGTRRKILPSDRREPPGRSEPCGRIRNPAAAAGAVLILLASCALNPGAPKTPPPAGPVSRPAVPAPDKSEGPLAALPPEARSFLTEFRARIRGGDWDWAADRADPSFLRAMEGRGRDPYFYTCLFAAGSLAGDAPEYGRFQLLSVSRVRDLAWEEARIEGPAAVVRGRFILSSGAPVPFELRLLWRLDPPRILGVQP